jgi:hypothetical protein
MTTVMFFAFVERGFVGNDLPLQPNITGMIVVSIHSYFRTRGSPRSRGDLLSGCSKRMARTLPDLSGTGGTNPGATL